MNLNTPSFKFYQPKDAAQKNLEIEAGADGLVVTMDPDSNAAVMTTNIPGTSISVEKAVVKRMVISVLREMRSFRFSEAPTLPWRSWDMVSRIRISN